MTAELIKKFRQDIQTHNLEIDPDVVNYAKHIGIKTTGDIANVSAVGASAATAAAPPPWENMFMTAEEQVIYRQQQELINHIRKKLGSNDKLDALMQLLIDKVKSTQDLQKLLKIALLLQEMVREIKQASK